MPLKNAGFGGIEEAAKVQLSAFLNEPEKAADTVGHITFVDQLQSLSDAMKADGNDKGAQDVMVKSIRVMKARKILPSVIESAERQVKRRS